MCSTTYGDLVCRGCRRFSHEVRDWNRYEDTEKRAVLTRLEQLQLQTLQRVFSVTDPERLWDACQQLRVRGARYDQDPLCWAAELVRMGGGALGRLDTFGIQVMPAYEHEPLEQLSEWLIKVLYQRAEAEYDRLHNTQLRF